MPGKRKGTKRKTATGTGYANRMARNKNAHINTVSVGLDNHIALDGKDKAKFKELVEELVLATTKIQIVGTRFLNWLLLYQFENNGAIPVINQTFVKKVLARFWNGHRPPPDTDADHAMITDAMQAFTAENEIEEHSLQAVYNGFGMGNVLSYVAQDLMTNYWNHVKENIHPRFYSFLRRFIVKIDAGMMESSKKKEFYEVTRVLAYHILKVANDEFDEVKLTEDLNRTDFDNDRHLAVDDSYRDFVSEMREQYANILPVQEHLNKNNFSDVLPMLYDLQQGAAEDAEFDFKELNENAPAKVIGRLCPKQFTLLPVVNLNAKYVVMDTAILHLVLRTIMPDEITVDRKEFVGNDGGLAFWRKTLKFPSELNDGSQFKFFVRINGVSVNFTYDREKRESDEGYVSPGDRKNLTRAQLKQKEKETATPLSEWPAPAYVDPNLVYAYDPGRRDYITGGRDVEQVEPDADFPEPQGVDGKLEGAQEGQPRPQSVNLFTAPSRKRLPKNRTRAKNKKKFPKRKKRRHRHGGQRKAKRKDHRFKSFSVSNAQWRAESGSKRMQTKREHWLKTDRDNQKDKTTSLYYLLQNMPSPKVSTVAELNVHSSYLLEILPRVLHHNVVRKRVRRSYFQGKIQRTAALDSLCRRMSGGHGKDAVVVLGAANCSSGFGYFPAPIKELRRRLKKHTRLVVLHEHYTSQRCSNCAFTDEYKASTDKLERGRKRVDGKTVKIHGVSWCPHQNCHTTWNRDVNAARNMKQLFWTMLNNGKVRPAAFAHEGAFTN